jgi:hypothetical protein
VFVCLNRRKKCKLKENLYTLDPLLTVLLQLTNIIGAVIIKTLYNKHKTTDVFLIKHHSEIYF